ncbi:MAG TPA: TatD family hydrolase [Gammaproteobacteria bacterium]|nr:TatD family hydrolase [Gammaproteobacteria bacterium]
MQSWIDIGANLTHESFELDREAVIERAGAAGVTRMIVTGADVAHSRAAVALARGYPGKLYATAGVHPHAAAGFSPETSAALRGLLAEPQVVAAGECGLDYFRDLAPRPAQREAFAAQIALAIECGKPLFLHQRDAHADWLAILDEFGSRLPAAVIHCFTGNAAELDDCLERGFHVGITGWICDERRGRHLAELLARIPPGRLMLETDAPYLLPRDLHPRPRTRRNEPQWLPHVARAVAAARRETIDELAAHTTASAVAFFGL